MGRDAILDLLKKDHWDLVEARTREGLALVRYRAPVLSGADVAEYGDALKVSWVFGPEGSRVSPSPEQSARMDQLEDRVCAALEHDALAVLTAVRTFGGARRWLFYTGDAAGCGARIASLPGEADPHPVQWSTESDPTWRTLRDVMLKGVERKG